MNSPQCIHIPVLQESQPARIRWAEVEGAIGYILERRLIGDPGRFSDSFGLVSNDEYFPAGNTGSPMNWKEFRDTGLSWDRIAEQQLAWERIKAPAESVTHLGFDDYIPEGAQFAQYRVRVVGADGQSGLVMVKPKDSGIDPDPGTNPESGLYKDQIDLAVQAGEHEYLLLTADSVRSLGGMTILYDPEALKLLEPAAHLPETGGGDGSLIIHSHTDGRLELSCTKEIPAGSQWSGPVTLLLFQALSSGPTKIQLK